MMEASDLPARRFGGISAPGRTSTAELEELFRSHEPRLGQFLAQVVRDRSLAEDLTQETFLTAVRQRQQLASIQNPEAWLFRIARNRALHALRTRRRCQNALQRLACERRDSRPAQGADPGDAVAVRDHLARHLKPDERALLILRYVHGFQSNELGEIVERSPEAVRQALSRARRKLTKSLDAEAQTTSPTNA
jgi:RNA polymerase sigma factor (sigma-70 family)